MKSKFGATFVIAAAALGAVNSFAYGSNDMNPDAFPALRPSQSTVSRADVRHDYANSVQNGSAPQYNVYGEVVAAPAHASGVSRAKVRTEYANALKAGDLPQYNQYGEAIAKPATADRAIRSEGRAAAPVGADRAVGNL
ncbi:MAG: DUF4148 domain-containing protein [Burkholderiales bacterium]